MVTNIEKLRQKDIGKFKSLREVIQAHFASLPQELITSFKAFKDYLNEIINNHEQAYNADLEQIKSAKLNELKAELAEMKREAKKTMLRCQNINPDRVVTLNVGGETVMSSQDTLTKIPGSDLEKLFSGKVNQNFDD